MLSPRTRFELVGAIQELPKIQSVGAALAAAPNFGHGGAVPLQNVGQGQALPLHIKPFGHGMPCPYNLMFLV